MKELDPEVIGLEIDQITQAVNRRSNLMDSRQRLASIDMKIGGASGVVLFSMFLLTAFGKFDSPYDMVVPVAAMTHTAAASGVVIRRLSTNSELLGNQGEDLIRLLRLRMAQKIVQDIENGSFRTNQNS